MPKTLIYSKEKLDKMRKKGHTIGLVSCNVCGRDFRAPLNNGVRYCSEECRIEGMKKEQVCQHCGEIFKSKNDNKYCSQRCASKASKGKAICPYCEEEFTKNSNRQKYCSEHCRQLDQDDFKAYRFDVFYRDGFRCRYCGKTPADGIRLTVDHVFPQSKGGQDDFYNLVTACSKCNSRKGNMLWDEQRIKDIWRKNHKLYQKMNKSLTYQEARDDFLSEYPEAEDYSWVFDKN